MKTLKIVLISISCIMASFSAFPQDNGTIVTKVKDLLSHLPNNDTMLVNKMMIDLLALGEKGITQVCEQVVPEGKDDDASPRFAIESLSRFLSMKNEENEKSIWERICIRYASIQTESEVKDFFMKQVLLTGKSDPDATLKTVSKEFENGNADIRAVCFKIISDWKGYSPATALYEICASGNKTFEGPAFEAYIRHIKTSDLADEEKLLLLRKIMPFALNEARKTELKTEIGKLKTQKGFVSLFNGKNLDGWEGDTIAYGVDNGLLVTIPSKGNIGNLYTTKEYSDFIIRFEFQLTPAANNGLGIRAPLSGDAAYVGMELQILDDSSPEYANLQPYQYHGSVYGVIPSRRGFLKPVGEWNYEEVTAKGTRIKIVLEWNYNR